MEFSVYINKKENEFLKKKIYKIINNKKSKISNKEKRIKIRNIIYKLIDVNLYTLYKQVDKKPMIGGRNKLVHILSKPRDTSKYVTNNNRNVCAVHLNKNDCTNNLHCQWSHNSCKFAITRKMVIEFVNKISVELVDKGLKSSELLMSGNYFVSDIVDYNRFTERSGQKIVQSTNYTIEKTLESLFGKGNIPMIGKRRSYVDMKIDYKQINIDNKMKNMGDYFVQNIIENNLTIYRAFANGYYWNKLKYFDMESRNLGYYSELQTSLANYFKSVIIDWLGEKKNKEIINNKLISYMDISYDDIYDYISMIGRNITTNTNCIVELYILNTVYKIPIYVFNNENDIIYIFDGNILYDANLDKEKLNKKDNKYLSPGLKKLASSIVLKFAKLNIASIPTLIEVLYYK